MGSSHSRAEFDPDTTKRSMKSKLPPNNHNKLVIFGENTLNQVAYLLPLSSGEETYFTRFQVAFQQGNPVIGVAIKEQNPQGIQIEKNSHMVVWYLAKGTIEYKGNTKHFQRKLPIVENGGDVVLQFVTATGKLSLTVTNPGKDSEVFEDATLEERGKLLPLVGDVCTGNSKTKFSILESSTIDDANNSLVDVTHKVGFTQSYGVVNIARDCKSVTRTSVQQGNGCALLPVKLSSGVHRWGFVIRCDFGASLCMGIARYPFKLFDEYARDHLKHIYRHPGLLVYRSYRGLLYRDGKALKESLDALAWQHGGSVTLEFIFDANRRTLEVLRNNKSLGVAFDNLTGSFQPIICFYAAYEKDIRLKHYLTTESSLDITAHVQSLGTSLEAGVSEVNSETIGFDKALLYGSINISSDSKSLIRESSHSGNSFCFLNATCTRPGTYKFVFVIEQDQGASTCIGVTQATTPAEVKVNDIGNIYTSPSLYLYRSYLGILYSKGKEEAAKMEPFFMTGSLLEMEINVDIAGCSADVGFKLNSMDQGIAFADLQPPLTPVIAFYSGMQKRVTILHYEHNPMNVPKEPIASTKLLPSENSSGLNNIATTLTYAEDCPLPIICSSLHAAMYYPSCMKCEGTNDIISLPCKHSTVCSKDLTLGVNAPTRHCMVCDNKITQVWNILLSS